MLRKTPGEVSVLAYLGRFTVDPTRSRSPGLVFVFDPGGLHPATLDLSGRLRFTFLTGRPGGPIDDATATMTFVEFVQLVRAPRITAQIFGLDFPLRADQLKVLWQFAEQIFPRSSQQGRGVAHPVFWTGRRLS